MADPVGVFMAGLAAGRRHVESRYPISDYAIDLAGIVHQDQSIRPGLAFRVSDPTVDLRPRRRSTEAPLHSADVPIATGRFTLGDLADVPPQHIPDPLYECPIMLVLQERSELEDLAGTRRARAYGTLMIHTHGYRQHRGAFHRGHGSLVVWHVQVTCHGVSSNAER